MNEHIYYIGKLETVSGTTVHTYIHTYVIVVYSGRFEHSVHAGCFVVIRDAFYYWSRFSANMV